MNIHVKPLVKFDEELNQFRRSIVHKLCKPSVCRNSDIQVVVYWCNYLLIPRNSNWFPYKATTFVIETMKTISTEEYNCVLVIPLVLHENVAGPQPFGIILFILLTCTTYPRMDKKSGCRPIRCLDFRLCKLESVTDKKGEKKRKDKKRKKRPEKFDDHHLGCSLAFHFNRPIWSNQTYQWA